MKLSRTIIAIAIVTTWSLSGCIGDEETPLDDEIDSILSALEQEDGGLPMTDEQPAFGEAERMSAAGLIMEGSEIDDPELVYGPGGQDPGIEGLPIFTGEQVFYSKFIDVDGTFSSLKWGTYQDAEEGQWVFLPDHTEGALMVHTMTVDGDNDLVDGRQFIATWAGHCDVTSD